MAARLAPRAPLLARSKSISTGAIVGATIGSVVGAVVIFLCVLPFVLRARRLRAFRRQHGEDAARAEFGQPDFLSPSHIGDAFRRLSHSAPPQPPHESAAAGDGQESTDQNADSVDKPRTDLYPAGVNLNYGLASPISPQLPAKTGLEAPPSRAPQDGRTATVSLSLATPPTHDSIPTQILSQESSAIVAEPSPMKQSADDSSAAPSRQGTFGSSGTVEQGSVGLGTRPSHRRRSGHLSDSVRNLAERAAAVLRRDSTLSTGSTRSLPLAPGDDQLPVASVPVVYEPIDTEARGEAYSYYHGFDAPETEPVPSHAQAGTYGPPISIPAPVSLSALASATAASAAISTTLVSPVGPRSQASPPTYSPTSGLPGTSDDDLCEEREEFVRTSPREKRGLDGPLNRVDTEPLKPIVADIESPPLPAKSEASVNPMDIWGPTTTTEKDHKTMVELSTPSPPIRLERTPSMEPFPSGPTPYATPGPEVAGAQDVDMGEEHITPELKQEEYAPGVVLPSPPQIAILGGDADMMQLAGRFTPPASSSPSNAATPVYMPNQPMAPRPSMVTPSPGSNEGPGDRPDVSPGPYRCEYCNRVFDQYHKLK